MSSQSSTFESHSSTGSVCNMCTKCATAVVSRCNNCRRYLCNACDIIHKFCFPTHTVTPVKNDAIELKKCYYHPDQSQIYFCRTCNFVICCQCIDHADHDRLEMRDKKEASTEMQQLLSEGKGQLDRLIYINSELTAKLQDLGKSRFSVLSYVNEMYQQHEALLKKYRDVIVERVEEKCRLEREMLVETKLELEKVIGEFSLKLSRFGEMAEKPKWLREPTSSPGSSLLSLNFDINDLLSDKSSKTDDLMLRELPNLSLEPDTKSEPDPSSSDPNSSPSTNPVNSLQIYKTFGQKGNGPGQFNSPHGFNLGFDEDIVVADSSNHRIQVFTKSGTFKFHFGISGRHDGHLWHPRKVAVLPTKRQYVVCDRGYQRSRMQIFSEDGRFIKKIYIQYIDIVAGFATTEDENIVVVDSVTPTVFIIGQDDFLRSLDCRDFIEEPSDIAVLEKQFYICDFKGHSIAVINEEGHLLRKFGDKQITTFPNGIAITDNGEILIGDSHGNFFHVSLYTKEGVFMAEFRCPYVKVSRCCGLKVTSDGYLITVDKNYHHVIMLDSIFIGQK